VKVQTSWDFPSLSHYASAIEREGRRLVSDIEAGVNALEVIMAYTEERLIRSKGKVKYTPSLHFCAGNHEQRLNRYISSKPELEGLIDLGSIVDGLGWNYYDFLQPIKIEGVVFRHYLVSPMTGKALGGTIENKLNKTPYSFVHGHQQQYQFGRRQNTLGVPHFGVCAGSFYMEDEDYRSYENTEIRGFVHLKHFTNRYDHSDFDVEFISLERLLEKY